MSTSWLSCDPAPNPKNLQNDNHWILYDLGEVYHLSALELWNYNESGKTDQGIHQYEVDISLDQVNWTYAGSFELNEAPGTAGFGGEAGPDLGGSQARYLLLTAIGNHGGECTGLSEIKIHVNNTTYCHDFDVEVAVYPNTCEYSSNGKIELNPSGGLESYTFEWNTGGSDSFLSGLQEGYYQVTVYDGNYCQEGMNIYLPDMTSGGVTYDEIPVPSGSYFETDNILSSGLVAYNGNVGFYSESGVELLAGFEVVPGGKFIASIADCEEMENDPNGYTFHFEASPSIQFYTDYIGAGHTQGVEIYTSHEETGTKGFYTMGGQGLIPDEGAASRFLSQSTFGADHEMIQQLNSTGIEEWLEWQFTVPRQNFNETFTTVIDDVWEDQGNGLTEFPYFRMAWWQNTMTGDDHLRDRIAFALSEIFVVSSYSDLKNFGEGLASYYDILHKHAFGNFRDLLFDVTLHPVMGLYLSHLNNPKSDPSQNQYPDENYAREVMQLFTIGLTKLNTDGSQLLDVYGNEILTYPMYEILEFAKVFTGLGFDAENAKFGSRRFYDFTVPMIMYADYHEPGTKYLLDGFVVPDGQTGMEDINDGVDNLFNHPNVGPFIGRRLIQRLVKSNPSPAYLDRVSTVFNDNGQGVRGDLKAVVRAILTDPEARDCSLIDQEEQGMLREPIVRYTHFLKAFNASSPSDTYYTVGNAFYAYTFQAPLSAPSVFNFFLPDYIPPGPAGGKDLYGPEFQILNSYTAIGYYNIVNYLKNNHNVMQSVVDGVTVDFSDELAIALDTDALVDRLDLILTHGTLSETSRNIISDALDALNPDPEQRLRMAIYLFFTCPEYAILK